MSDNTTASEFFDGIGSGVGAPGALLKNTGDLVKGEIVEMFKRDYVPFGKEEPQKKADGTNRQQLVILLQTENRNWANVNKVPKVDPKDPNSPEKDPSEDDGVRAVYVPEVAKGLGSNNIAIAIAKALQAAKVKPEIGGTLGVKVDNLKDTGQGNPLKEHVAFYQAPAPKAAGDDFFPQQEQAPATPAQEAAPAAPAPAATPAPAQDPWASSGSTSTDEPPF